MNRRMMLATAALALAACKKAEQPAPPPVAVFRGLTVSDSFRTPESVLYDSLGDAYLVSNINGAGTAKDDNGFISRINPDGRLDMLKFIDGSADSVTLNAPKGMAIKGDTLFVADIDVVRMFNRVDGHALGFRPVRGATFLNDVAVGPDGTVYITDSGLKPDFSSSGTDAVYRFDAHGAAVAIARGVSLGRPNGIVVDSTGAVVVTFGSGEVYHLSAAGVRTNLPTPPAGQLDGVMRLPDHSLLVSSWADSTVWHLAPGDSVYHAVARSETPADIGVDGLRHRLLIPVFNQNRVLVRPLP